MTTLTTITTLWMSWLAAATPQLASSGRLDLTASEAVGRLEQGRFVSGGGKVERMNWVAEHERPRGYTVTFPVAAFRWSEHVLRFVPEKSGAVKLALMGVWERSPDDPNQRVPLEIYWDALQVSGGQLDNAGFEQAQGAVPTGWWSGGGRTEPATASLPAVEGGRFARTWHDAVLAGELRVTGGQAVTIRFHARAVVPPGWQEMQRITRTDTAAHVAARRFRRGINLSNYLETPPGQDWGGGTYSAEDFAAIRAEGFDHVRIPVGWHHYTGPAPEFRLRPEIVQKADALVEQALKHGLNAIVNLHHFDDFTTAPAAHEARFHAIWRQLAEHYAAFPDQLAFELLNEPHGAATTAVMNGVYARSLPSLRRTNPRRTVFVGPSQWNQISELGKLRLPDDDTNLIVSVHSYDPFYFTHQGATWGGPDTKVTGIRFPGPPPTPLTIAPGLQVNSWVREWVDAYNRTPTEANASSPAAFRPSLQTARDWSRYYGRPIHVGEFGCYEKAPADSRAGYYRAFREAAEEAELGWAMWDWKAGFRYWDRTNRQPVAGMRAALFGK